MSDLTKARPMVENSAMLRTVGPLAISEQMRFVLRLCRAIRESLPAYAVDATPTGTPEGSLAAVSRVEAELGASLPDDVLAAMFCRIPLVKAASRIMFDHVLDFVDEPQRGVLDDWIAIARVPPNSLDEHYHGAHGSELNWVCVRRNSSPETNQVDIDGSGPCAWGAHIESQLSSFFRREPSWLEIRARANALPDDPASIPRLVGEAVRIGAAPARRVVHPKFGTGTVVSVTDGKLEIDFDDGSRRVLLARVVVDAPLP